MKFRKNRKTYEMFSSKLKRRMMVIKISIISVAIPSREKQVLTLRLRKPYVPLTRRTTILLWLREWQKALQFICAR